MNIIRTQAKSSFQLFKDLSQNSPINLESLSLTTNIGNPKNKNNLSKNLEENSWDVIAILVGVSLARFISLLIATHIESSL